MPAGNGADRRLLSPYLHALPYLQGDMEMREIGRYAQTDGETPIWIYLPICTHHPISKGMGETSHGIADFYPAERLHPRAIACPARRGICLEPLVKSATSRRPWISHGIARPAFVSRNPASAFASRRSSVVPWLP